jgi:dihydrofolate reductase
MRSIKLLLHLSLDGFVAGPRGDLSYFSPSDDNLAFVNGLTADADAALFGRVSYTLLNDYWPFQYNNPKASIAEVNYSNWYNIAQKIVVSNTLTNVQEENTIIIHDNIAAELLKIKQMPGKSILIFGSPTLSQALINSSLIDDYWLFIHPQLFGNGLPFTSNLQGKVNLQLVQSHQLPNGEVANLYVKKQDL